MDDDAETCRFMQELLRAPGRRIESARDPEDALRKARGGGFDLVVSDINLNAELSGIDLLRAFKAADADVEVLLVSGFGSLETALEAVRAGAFDYVSKPFDIEQVKETVERALRRRARLESGETGAELPELRAPDGLVGRSGAMLQVYKLIAQATRADAPVLVTGETGTGKELVARAIHRHGRRANRPFLPVNCGALPEGLLESELFGHVRGAFTGAVGDKKGLFAQADGGTLFLDEIGEMPAPLQVRLLRVLEAGEVRPVGSVAPFTVDVRVIAATHRDLEQAVADGRFRQDLFYRLNVLRIPVPPLRERRSDVPLLAAHFLKLVSGELGRGFALTQAALQALASRDWPGNVRELENAVRRAAHEAPGELLDAEDLGLTAGPRAKHLEDPLFEGLPTLEEMEKRYLRHVLEATGGNRSRAAELLGIDRRTLYRMAERFGLPLDE